MSTPTAIHMPLDPMTLEIHPFSSSHVSWVYKWSNVDLNSKVECFSPDFGHANGWVWRLLLQHHQNPDGNRVYSIFLYVVLTDTELREPTWTRKIRVMQFQILNSEGRRLKDKSTIALFNEHQLTWGFPGLIDTAHLLRDPVVAASKTVDIICRLRYLPEFEKIRRPMSPPVSGVYGPTPDLTDHNAAAKVFDSRAVVVDPVGSSLRSLVNNPTFSDIQIVVGPEMQTFHGHKAILAARSVWFESALNPLYKEAHEGVIRLPEEDPKIFEMLFEFLYTGDYPLATASSIGLLRAPSPVPKTITSKHEARTTSNRSSPSTTPSPTPLGLRQFRHAKDARSSPGPGVRSNLFGYNLDEEEANALNLEDFDDMRFQLYLMADKYGVSQLKCLIRVHLTNELLDPASGIQNQAQGQRLLKLIRFAFEDLPEAVTSSGSTEMSDSTALRCPSAMSTLSSLPGARHRDSGLGDDGLIDDGGLADRVVSPGVPGFERVYARGASVFSTTNSTRATPAGRATMSQPDGSNAARVLSSVFAPPSPPPVNGHPVQSGSSASAGPSGMNSSGVGSSSSGGVGLFGSGPSMTSGASAGTIGFSMSVGPESTITAAMTTPPIIPPSSTMGTRTRTPTTTTTTTTSTISAATTITPSHTTDLVLQREREHNNTSRTSDRDTRRVGSAFGFRGGWQSCASNMTGTSLGGVGLGGVIGGNAGERQGRYGRDNETQLLRDAIVLFVAKMFPAVRRIEGFEDLMKEGGDLGGFATEVMDRMFRP